MLLFVVEGKEDVFHEFEEKAIPILKDYNGKLLYRIRPTDDTFISSEGENPYEVHFLSFPSDEDFICFTRDKRRNEFLHLKEESVKSTLLIKGMKL
jgi:hypothetical protein